MKSVGIFLLVMTVAFALIGCASKPEIPLDVKRIVASGQAAKSKGALNDAIVHFNSALDKYPELAAARLARGESYLALADRDATATGRTSHLEAASTDFAMALEHGIGAERISAFLQAGRAYEALAKPDRALEVYAQLRAEDDAPSWSVAEANRRSGDLLLEKLHLSFRIDAVVPVENTEARTLSRRALFYFEETLQHQPGAFQALLGKGVCLLHSGNPHAAVDSLRIAQRDALDRRERLEAALTEEAATTNPSAIEPSDEVASPEPTAPVVPRVDDPQIARRDTLVATYLLAVAREYDIGINQESNRMYLEALRLEADRDFTPLYLRLYARLSGKSSYTDGQRREIVSMLAKYDNGSDEVWERAVEYLGTLEVRQPSEVKLSAIAHARLGDSTTAFEEFETWWQSTVASAATAEAVIERVFRVIGGMTTEKEAALALSRARAYRTAFPSGDHPQRDDVLDQLRRAIGALSGHPRPAAKQQRVALCAYLSEEILANLDLDPQNRESLLLEARSLTETESNLAPHRPEPELRAGKIQEALNPDADLLGYAERAIERDRTFDPAYQVVHSSYRSLTRQTSVSEKERALRDRLANHLVDYEGNDPQISTARKTILDARREAKAAAEAERQRQKEAAAARARADRFRPCVECFAEVKKSEANCPHCGAQLPAEDPEDDGG
ncbi:MAG: hypothetical protein AAF488_04085 [Planctomycetota bacterium]